MPAPFLPTVGTAVSMLSGTGAAVPLWAATFAQDVPGLSDGNVPNTVLGLLATAVTSMVAVNGWLLRRFLSGEWVRVDQAAQSAELERTRRALEEANKRESDYLDMLKTRIVNDGA